MDSVDLYQVKCYGCAKPIILTKKIQNDSEQNEEFLKYIISIIGVPKFVEIFLFNSKSILYDYVRVDDVIAKKIIVAEEKIIPFVIINDKEDLENIINKVKSFLSATEIINLIDKSNNIKFNSYDFNDMAKKIGMNETMKFFNYTRICCRNAILNPAKISFTLPDNKMQEIKSAANFSSKQPILGSLGRRNVVRSSQPAVKPAVSEDAKSSAPSATPDDNNKLFVSDEHGMPKKFSIGQTSLNGKTLYTYKLRSIGYDCY